MSRLVLVADTVYTGDDHGTELDRGVVEIVDGRIAHVGPVVGAVPRGADVVDLGAQVLLPGLVNAHTHTPMTLFRGIAEGASLLTMQGWKERIRSLEDHLDPAMMPAAVEVACAEMIESGTTFFADQYFGVEHYRHVVQRSGLRAELAYGIVELGDDAARESSLAAAERFLDSAPLDPLIGGWVGPHFLFVDNQLDAIQAETAMATAYGVGLHTHFATTGDEDALCRERFGMSALRMMERLGVLDRRVILAHANLIDIDELDLLAGRPITLVAAPSVAMTSGAPVTPVRAALDAGVNVALGTDNVCNSNGFDLFEEMRALGRAASLTARRPGVLSPRELLGIATWRGHRALTGGDLAGDGRIAEGGVADLVALPVRALRRGPRRAQSLESALVYGAQGPASSTVLVGGRFLKRDGELTTLDPAEAIDACETHFDRLLRQAAPTSAVAI
ncbi:MAG: amidohydrolase family protein [Naasia sp.]